MDPLRVVLILALFPGVKYVTLVFRKMAVLTTRFFGVTFPKIVIPPGSFGSDIIPGLDFVKCNTKRGGVTFGV